MKKDKKETVSETKKRKYEKLFGNHFAQKYTEEYIERLADEMLEWFKKKENIWLKDFSISKMFSQQRISEFAKKNEYFSEIYNICKEMQESKLFKLGLSKNVNAALPIIALKSNCGWTDRQEINLPEKIKVTLPKELGD